MIGALAFASATIRWDRERAREISNEAKQESHRCTARRVIQYLMTMRDLKIRWKSEEDKVPTDK
jgi:hypothetical protein